MSTPDSNTTRPLDASLNKADQLQSFIHPGKTAEITERNGRVRQIYVTHIDSKTITGTASTGPVNISIADVRIARVWKAPPPIQSTPTPVDGEWTTTEVDGKAIIGAAVIIGDILYSVSRISIP